MELKTSSCRTHRPGAVTVLSALLMVFLLIMVAFAVDLGWIIVVRLQLQNATMIKRKTISRAARTVMAPGR